VLTKQDFYKGLHYAYHALSQPVSTAALLGSSRIHPAYRMTLARKQWLGARMMMNNIFIKSGTIYKLHLAMALKILETPPDVAGDVVECGSWKGGSAANLSLVCKITGRKLRIYDSFQGLPPAKADDREGSLYKPGDYAGTLDEVKENIRRYGAIECCEFVQGWFEDTLPALKTPVLLAYMDVDLEDSLATCVKYLWPNIVDGGYLFTDECLKPSYISLFFSERWWKETLDTSPPGLIGGGTGLGLGTFYVGPDDERTEHPLQYPGTGAYTRKNAMTGLWTYYPRSGEGGARSGEEGVRTPPPPYPLPREGAVASDLRKR
jgi:O-methyltransferase